MTVGQPHQGYERTEMCKVPACSQHQREEVKKEKVPHKFSQPFFQL